MGEVLSRNNGASSGYSCGKPLIVNSASGHTPFGSTHFYALPGLAFEVMQNGFLASVTVFSVPPDDVPDVFRQRKPSSLVPGILGVPGAMTAEAAMAAAGLLS